MSNPPLYNDPHLQEKARRGNPQALYALGLRHFRGDGIPEDKREAFRLFREAALLGSRRARFDLGYHHGINGDRTPSYALGWEEEWKRLCSGEFPVEEQNAVKEKYRPSAELALLLQEAETLWPLLPEEEREVRRKKLARHFGGILLQEAKEMEREDMDVAQL